MAAWLDFSPYGMDLFVGLVQPAASGAQAAPERVVALAGDTGPHAATLTELGFTSDDAGIFFHRTQPNMGDLVRRFPKIKIIRDIDIRSVARPLHLKLSQAPQAPQAQTEEKTENTKPHSVIEDIVVAVKSKDGQINEHGQKIFSVGGKDIVRIGQNHLGQDVYSLDGRRFIISENGPIFHDDTKEPTLFLRAKNYRQLVRLAGGLVSAAKRGENIRAGDLRQFAAATQERAITDELDLTTAALAVEAASMQALRDGIGGIAETFSGAARIQEAIAYRGDLAREGFAAKFDILPLPALVAARRVVGTNADYKDKKLVSVGVALPLLKSAPLREAVFFLRDAARVEWLKEACLPRGESEGGTKYSVRTNANDTEESDILLYWGGAPKLSEEAHKTSNGVVFRREDFGNFAVMLERRAESGRSVAFFLETGDEEEDRFFAWLVENYTVEGIGRLEGALHGAIPGIKPLLMVTVGMRRPEPMAEPPKEAFDRTDIINWQDLFVWTNQIIQARAAINTYYQALKKEKEEEVAAKPDGESSDVKPEQNKFQAVYASASKIGEASTMVPRNMDAATRRALSRLVKKYRDIDQMVSNELQIPLDVMAEVLSPEQVDAIALAIDALARGRAFLIGDQTGIGKGRTLAALMYREIIQGRIPFFFTEREINISDIWRDFVSIGVDKEISPFFMNTGVKIIDGLTDAVIMRGNNRAQIQAILESKEWPEDSNILISTYSQINRPYDGAGANRRRRRRDRSNIKMEWLSKVMEAFPDRVSLFLDESHNAASNSNISNNIHYLLNRTTSCVFSSATFAKETRHVDFYNRLFPVEIARGGDPISSVLRRGGEALQETMASMLAADGVLIRREHDLSKCEFTIALDSERVESHRKKMDEVAPVLADLANLSGDISSIINEHNAQIEERVFREFAGDLDEARIMELTRRVRSMQIRNVAFGSPLYRISRLFTSSLLIEKTVEEAISALLRGEKPIILLESTSETVLNEMLKENAINEQPTLKTAVKKILEQLIRHAMNVAENPAALKKENLENTIIEITTSLLAHTNPEELIADINLDGTQENNNLAKERLKEALRGAILSAADSIHEKQGELVEITQEEVADAVAGLVRRINASQDIDNLSRYFSIPSLLLDPTLRRRIKGAEEMIETLPELPLSVIDAIKEGIENKGRELFDEGVISKPWRCGELTGRKLEFRDGEIRKRTDRDVMSTKNGFNSGEIDALVMNVVGATGISLHAGANFGDQRPRVIIENQAPTDILRVLQAYGRINRFDQVANPRIVSVLSGLPMETRLLLMRNAKLVKLSANTTANKEHSSLVPAPDILNAVGDRVVSNYLGMRPELCKRLGLNPSAIREDERENLNNEQNAEEERLDKRSANELLSRLVMLPTEEQRICFEEIVTEYNSYIEELDASGSNPLRSHMIEGKVYERGIWPVSGFDVIDNDIDKSAFHSPVFAKEISIEHQVLPINSETVVTAYERGLVAMQSDNVLGYADEIEAERDKYIAGFLPIGADIDQSIASGRYPTVNIINNRVLKLISALRTISAGCEVTLSFEGYDKRAIVTRLIPPDKREMFAPSSYRVQIAIPGASKINSVSLRTLIDSKEFTVSDGLNGDEADKILVWFDTQGAGKRFEKRLILVRNEWEAVEMSLERNLGTLSQWVDESGIVNRGVLISPKKEAEFMSAPIPIKNPNVIWHIMSHQKPGGSKLSRVALFTKPVGASFQNEENALNPDDVKVSMRVTPKFIRAVGGVNHGLIKGVIENLFDRANGQKNQAGHIHIKLNQEQLNMVWNAMQQAGVEFFVEAKFRRDIMAAVDELRLAAKTHQPSDNKPRENSENDEGGPKPETNYGQ